MESTLADVARAVGCSNATVSRVINNMGQVSQTMRESVLRAMKDLNYVPRPATANDADSSTNDTKPNALLEVIYFTDTPYERVTLDKSDLKIAPLTPCPPEERLASGNWLSNSFYRSIADGIIYEAPFWGFKPTIQIRSNLNDANFLAELNQPGKAGVLLVGEYSAQLDTFAQACQHPLVLVDLIVAGAAPIVTFDNFSGIAQAFEHLFALGHRRFGFLGGLQSAVAYRERLTAFRYKLVEHGLPIDERLIYTGNQHMATTAEWAEAVLRDPRQPTAFLCANDFMAIALLKTAHRLGIAIPGELSVVGFDDIEPASLVTPALTTVRTPTFEIGRQAVQQLCVQAKLGARRNRRGTCIRLTPELIVRESCGKAIQ
jgi:LacI family transcriptional regulator